MRAVDGYRKRRVGGEGEGSLRDSRVDQRGSAERGMRDAARNSVAAPCCEMLVRRRGWWWHLKSCGTRRVACAKQR